MVNKFWEWLFPKWELFATSQVYSYSVDYGVEGVTQLEHAVTIDDKHIPPYAMGVCIHHVQYFVCGKRRKVRMSTKGLRIYDIDVWVKGFTDLPAGAVMVNEKPA